MHAARSPGNPWGRPLGVASVALIAMGLVIFGMPHPPVGHRLTRLFSGAPGVQPVPQP